MLKRLIVAVLALIMVASPSMAFAKHKEKAPAPAPAATAPVQNGTSPFLDYNLVVVSENFLYLDLSTGKRVAIRLMPLWAPNAVERIKTLTRQGFYNGVIFHRVIEGFMAQTGDPTGTGKGGSNLPNLKAEFNPMPHLRGTVSMARADDPDSANSQFFIMFQPRFALDRKYTDFGRVIAGMDAVDEIQRGEPPANPTKILQASIAADNKPPPVITAPQPAADVSADTLNNSVSEPDASAAPQPATQAPPAAQQPAPAPAPAPAAGQ